MLSAGTLKFGPNIKVTDPCYDNSKDLSIYTEE